MAVFDVELDAWALLDSIKEDKDAFRVICRADEGGVGGLSPE